MTQTVTMPDGSIHNFPDEATPEMMSGALGLQQSEPSLGNTAMSLAKPMIDAFMGTPNKLGGQLANNVGLATRYGIEGITTLPNMVGNVANSAINIVLPDQYKLGMPSNTTSQILTNAGLPQPQGAQQEIVGDMSRSIAALGTSMGLGLAVPQLSSLTQNPLMQARAAMGSSAASGLTAQAGGGPIPQVIAGLAGGYGATRTPFTPEPQTIPLSEQLKSDARDSYAEAKNTGATFNQATSTSLPSQIESDWASTGKMNARLHGDSLSILDDLKDDASKGDLSLEDLHQYRQLFGDVVNKNLHPNGSMMPDAMKANQAINAIDDTIDSAAKNPSLLSNGSPDAIAAFQKAQGLWKQSNQVGDIERIMDRAETMQQPATAVQTGFRTLLNNPKRLNRFSPEAQDLIENAATVSLPAEVLRGLGSRLIPAIMAGSGGIGSSMAAQAAQSIPRNLATQMQMNRGQAVINSIAQPNSLMMPIPNAAKQIGTMQGIIPELQYGSQQ